PDDEIVMAAGLAPIRAKKARHYSDRRLAGRVIPPPAPGRGLPAAHDWMADRVQQPMETKAKAAEDDDAANGGIRQEPELPVHEDIAPPPPRSVNGEFDFSEDGAQADAARLRAAADRQMARGARAAALDPDDGVQL
ncbi:MAG: conjugal transfer protein TraG, partial [Afipia sp.]|nr:conjugal transfer protein TraG [Afipia sp.]